MFCLFCFAFFSLFQILMDEFFSIFFPLHLFYSVTQKAVFERVRDKHAVLELAKQARSLILLCTSHLLGLFSSECLPPSPTTHKSSPPNLNFRTTYRNFQTTNGSGR